MFAITTEDEEKVRATIDSSTEHVAQFFTYAHLPEHLRKISLPFAMMAAAMLTTLPRNPERTVALRKLLESKDAAVRAALAKAPASPLVE